MTTRNSPFIDSNKCRLVTHEELNWIWKSIVICLKSFLILLKTSTRRSSLKFSLKDWRAMNPRLRLRLNKFTPIVHSTVIFRSCFNLQCCIDSTEWGEATKTQRLRQVKRVEWSDLTFCVLLNFIALNLSREIDFISTFHNFISSRFSLDSSDFEKEARKFFKSLCLFARLRKKVFSEEEEVWSARHLAFSVDYLGKSIETMVEIQILLVLNTAGIYFFLQSRRWIDDYKYKNYEMKCN